MAHRREPICLPQMPRRAFLAITAGGLLAAPLAAEGQPARKSYRVGFLALTPGEDTASMKPLLERLHEMGYDEGRNMTFEYRSAEGRSERLPQLAMELVRGRPDVLIAGFGTLTAQAAKPAWWERHRPERPDRDWRQAPATPAGAQSA